MRPRHITYAVLVLSISVTGYLAGADFGTTDVQLAKVAVSRPPDQLLRGRTLLVKSQNGVPFATLPALTAAISQAMSSDFTPVNADADLTLTFSVTAQDPITPRTYTVSEQRVPVTGTGLPNIPTLPGPFGRGASNNLPKPTPVTYWEAHGKLIVQVSVTNRANVPVDSYTTKGEYSKKIETAEGGKPKQVQMPSVQALNLELQQSVVREIQRRYTKMTETIEIRLAPPDPLKAGLKLAQQNQWKEALAQWAAAKAPKNESERDYNMAVANEALFYNSDYMNNPDEGDKPAQEAARLYAEALRLDPSEKFFRQADERSKAMQENLNRARQQWAVLQREKALLEASVPNNTGPGAKGIGDAGSDTPDEADFRDIIRARLRRRDDKPTPDYQTELEKMGANSYKLPPDSAKRIVQQEVAGWQDYHNNIEEYRQLLKDLIGKDKTLDAKGRDQLNRFATRTQLSKEDVARVEAELKFTDQTKPAAAPGAARPAPQR